jgi:hypothetical protein
MLEKGTRCKKSSIANNYLEVLVHDETTILE